MEQPIQDKAKKPAGLVPKNLQAFLLVGLALLMVVIMALTGHKRPVPVGSGTTPVLPTIVPVNADRVADFQESIEQSQRESAPQAEAALLTLQEQLANQTATGQPPSLNRYGSPVTSANPNGTYPPDAYASADNQPPDGGPPVDDIHEERKKRTYLSLFSDNARSRIGRSCAVPQHPHNAFLPLECRWIRLRIKTCQAKTGSSRKRPPI